MQHTSSGGHHMPTGTVKWFSDEKGFGFITPDEGSKRPVRPSHRHQRRRLPLARRGREGVLRGGAGRQGPEGGQRLRHLGPRAPASVARPPVARSKASARGPSVSCSDRSQATRGKGRTWARRSRSASASSFASRATRATGCSWRGPLHRRHRRCSATTSPRCPTSRPRSAPPPARSRGVSAFQIHFASRDILTPGDTPNVLVAMNPAALKANLGDARARRAR